jgi:hypothetical protein
MLDHDHFDIAEFLGAAEHLIQEVPAERRRRPASARRVALHSAR